MNKRFRLLLIVITLLMFLLILFAHQIGNYFYEKRNYGAAKPFYSLDYHIWCHPYSVMKLTEMTSGKEQLSYFELLIKQDFIKHLNNEDKGLIYARYIISMFGNGMSNKARDSFKILKNNMREEDRILVIYSVLRSANSKTDDYNFAISECNKLDEGTAQNGIRKYNLLTQLYRKIGNREMSAQSQNAMLNYVNSTHQAITH
ncbi:MAG: hypothetical protein ACM3QZ_04590 [Solirubrobacterales bacterium]